MAKNSKNSIFGSHTFAANFVFKNGAESQKNISGPLVMTNNRNLAYVQTLTQAKLADEPAIQTGPWRGAGKGVVPCTKPLQDAMY